MGVRMSLVQFPFEGLEDLLDLGTIAAVKGWGKSQSVLTPSSLSFFKYAR